jgi:sugar phosphate isomerase/epimerase
MERDLKLAARLGFPVIRVLCPVRKEIVQASIPIAESYGVKMGLEVHTPMTLKARWMTEYMEMAAKSGSKYVGIVADFGIFLMRPSKKQLEDALKSGARLEILEKIVGWCEEHLPFAELMARTSSIGANPAESAVSQSFARNVFTEPDALREIAPYLFHCHAKFYDMDESCEETSIDYINPIRILKEIGYDGYLSSEFEGQRLYGSNEECDEMEQVRRHHVMLKRLLGE